MVALHHETLSKYSDVDDVQRFISEKRMVQNIVGSSLHNLFADMNGNAIVTETDNKENFITEMKDDFIVMTNFANHSLIDKSYKEAAGVGADRYKIAYEYLLENKSSFSVDKGFDLLKKAICQDPGYPTLCSMIFLPQTNNIYIAINQNYEKIWKISLDRQMIKTHKGYNKHSQVRLGPEGILATDLELIGS